MTHDNAVLPAAPPDVCALVVGIEKNGFTTGNQRAELRGSALLAARFARWLLVNGVCRPERLTLMTAYNTDACTDGTYDADKSPTAMINEVRALAKSIGPDINPVTQADTLGDFRKWVTGSYGPRSTDRRFILFWVGHGLTYPDRRLDRRLCLIGGDASGYQLSHVELTNLLHIVGSVAQHVHEVALVDACQGSVPDVYEKTLEDGCRPVSLPPGVREGKGRHTYTQSIAFAAAPGHTTRLEGWGDKTFSELLLEKLEQLPGGQGPERLFDPDPARGIAADLHRDPAFRQRTTTFGYFHEGNGWLAVPPASGFDVTDEEWKRLHKLAKRIDLASGPRTSDIRWGALCHAVGLDQILGPGDGPDTATRLVPVGSLEQLFTMLYGWAPKSYIYPPPLVVACDYVANLPQERTVRGLDTWCTKWARRAPDGARRLANAKGKRPPMPPDRDFLGVLVDDEEPLPGRRHQHRYQLKGFIWTLSGPHRIGRRGPVTSHEVAGGVAELISMADELEVVAGFEETIIDVALPRDLIGHPFEYDKYNGNQELGQYAITVRDLDRLRGRLGPRVRELTVAAWERVIDFERSGDRQWFQQVQWVRCETAHQAKLLEINEAAPKKLGFVLEHKLGFVVERSGRTGASGANGTRRNAPPELAHTLDRGAAVILFLHHTGDCGRCSAVSRSQEADRSECAFAIAIAEAKKKIQELLDHPGGRGLVGLPITIRDLRGSLQRMGLKAGVLLDDQSRLWADFEKLASGAMPGNN